MKKRDILRLFKAILVLENRTYSVKFSYFLAKTKLALKEEITTLETLGEVSQEFKKYDSERAKLAHRLADKNEDGSSIINNNNFVITKNVELFQEELASLKIKYEDVISERKIQTNDFNLLLDEVSDFKGIQLDIKDIPDEIEPSVIEILMLTNLIKE